MPFDGTLESLTAPGKLAESPSAAGIAALRFDYFGTGNSARTDEGPNRVQVWLDSIGAAVWRGAPEARREQSDFVRSKARSPAFVRELLAVDLAEIDPRARDARPAARALVIARDDVPGPETKLVEHLRELGVE